MAGKRNNKPGKKAVSPAQKGGGKAAAPEEKRAKTPRKAFKYPGRGRPREYTDPDALARGCEKYFASISQVEEIANPVTGEPELSSLGRPIERVVWLMQPSMGGLARSLGITDRTLRSYGNDELMAPVVEWAKGVCRDYLVEQVTTREKGSLNGLIFVLENNYGMRERVEVEARNKTIEELLAEYEGDVTEF